MPDQMTDAQREELENLSRQTGEEMSGHMTSEQAQAKIEELRGQAGTTDAPQDAGVGPIEGDEAMDDNTEFKHTPTSPTAR
jgi:hypothetical protein